jgi:biopolymer transport protein ExbB
MKKIFKTSLFGGLALLGGLATQAWAQEEAKGGTTLGDVFENAGTIGWAIVGLSVVALAVIIKFFVDLKREKLAPPDLLDELDGLMDEGNFEEALQLCEDEPTFLTNVVQAGLAKAEHPFEVIRTAVEEALDEESVKLHLKVGYLSLIAQVAPMAGLLGTVGGMIQAFGVIAMKETGVSPKDLAGGIKAALITTLFGLIVAIPTASFFVFFRNRVIMLILEVTASVDDLFERLREKK